MKISLGPLRRMYTRVSLNIVYYSPHKGAMNWSIRAQTKSLLGMKIFCVYLCVLYTVKRTMWKPSLPIEYSMSNFLAVALFFYSSQWWVGAGWIVYRRLKKGSTAKSRQNDKSCKRNRKKLRMKKLTLKWFYYRLPRIQSLKVNFAIWVCNWKIKWYKRFHGNFI